MLFAKQAKSTEHEITGKSSLTISRKPVVVWAAYQAWILAGERSLLPMHIAATVSASLCVRTKS